MCQEFNFADDDDDDEEHEYDKYEDPHDHCANERTSFHIWVCQEFNFGAGDDEDYKYDHHHHCKGRTSFHIYVRNLNILNMPRNETSGKKILAKIS